MEDRYVFNNPNGNFYYAHAWDQFDSFCEDPDNKRCRERKNLDDFLMRAVDSIDFSYEFENDPSLKYNFHSKAYIWFLFFSYLGLFLLYLTFFKIDKMIKQTAKADLLNDAEKMRPIIVRVIYFDCFIMVLVLLSGIASKWTIKTRIYKLHSICLISSILSIIPLSFLSRIYLLVFTTRIMCYIYWRYIVSLIYNSFVYPIFQSIEDIETRRQAVFRFNNFVKFGQAQEIQGFANTHDAIRNNAFSVSHLIFGR